MKFTILSYTFEIQLYKSGHYGRHYAKKLLNRYWLNPANTDHKIGLIKLLRQNESELISLRDAKEAIETMFDFSTELPTVK